MKYFIASLLNLEKENLEPIDVEIFPGVRLCSDNSIKEKILTEDIIAYIGLFEYDSLMNNGLFLYYEFAEEDINKFNPDATNIQVLHLLLNWINAFLRNSWIVKDNAIVIGTAYLIDDSSITKNRDFSSLQLQYKHTLADGGIRPIKLSRKELDLMIEVHDKVEMYLSSKDSLLYKFPIVKNFSTIGRFLFFIKAARESRNLGHKVLNYCSSLETLFSTDNTEISHKIGERTAYFLSDGFNKKEVYEIIKKAYAIRSKLVHGSHINNKTIKETPEISEKLDDILRKIFNLIFFDNEKLEIFDSNNSRINDYFIDLILG